MKQEEIIEMARQADIDHHRLWNDDGTNRLEGFAELVVAREREIIIAKNLPEIERCNAHIKMLEDALSSYMQLFLDPENQPTQFGTATQKYREQEIKDERELCAKICGEYNFGQTPKMIQDAIRARGEA